MDFDKCIDIDIDIDIDIGLTLLQIADILITLISIEIPFL